MGTNIKKSVGGLQVKIIFSSHMSRELVNVSPPGT